MIFARIERAEKGLSNGAKIIKNGALDLEIGNVFVTNLVKNHPHLTRIFVTIFRPREAKIVKNGSIELKIWSPEVGAPKRVSTKTRKIHRRFLPFSSKFLHP